MVVLRTPIRIPIFTGGCMYCKKALTNDKLLLSSMRVELDEYLDIFYSHWTEFELENADSKIELAKNAIERAQKHLDMAMKTLDQIELE